MIIRSRLYYCKKCGEFYVRECKCETDNKNPVSRFTLIF